MSNVKTQKAAIGNSTIKWAYVLISVFLIALGVCTFIWPQITAITICYAIGSASVVFGVIKIISYFTRELRGVALTYDFSTGLLAIIAGLALLIGRDRIVDLLQVILGIYLIVDSVLKLQTAIDAKRLGISGWWISLFFTIACLGLGIVLVINIGSNYLMMLIGASLIADGLQNLCLVIFSAVAAKALAKLDMNSDGTIDVMQHPESPAPAGPAPAAEATPPTPQPEAPKAEPQASAPPTPEPQEPEPQEAETPAHAETGSEPNWYNLPPV